MGDRQRAVGHTPLWWRGQVRHLHEGDIVGIEFAVGVPAVKAHFRARGVRTWVELADLLEAHDVRPELVRLLHIADVQHEVIDAHRGHSLAGRRWSVRALRHKSLPLCVLNAVGSYRIVPLPKHTFSVGLARVAMVSTTDASRRVVSLP